MNYYLSGSRKKDCPSGAEKGRESRLENSWRGDGNERKNRKGTPDSSRRKQTF